MVVEVRQQEVLAHIRNHREPKVREKPEHTPEDDEWLEDNCNIADTVGVGVGE